MMPKTRPLATRASPVRASLVGILLLAACQPAADDADSGSEAGDPSRPRPAAAESGAPAAVGDSTARAGAPLPGLVAVKSGLERLSRGVWSADYDTIAAATGAIATHPQVPPAERQQIAAILGPDMAAFKGVDTEIHDLAVRIEGLSGEGDIDAILTAEAGLRAGCVACHTRFRDRIREALR